MRASLPTPSMGGRASGGAWFTSFAVLVFWCSLLNNCAAAIPIGLQAQASATATPALAGPSASPSPTPAPRPSPAPPSTSGPSDERRLERITTISGGLTPKSVVASQTGLFFVQNMIYGHTIKVFDRSFALVATIRDRVVPARFGYPSFTQPVRGGPVEAAFDPTGSTVYVSNYSMYGPGFGHPGYDTCEPGAQIDRSFVYRIDPATFLVTGAVLVGKVPKFLAVSPDGGTLAVANWCSGTVSLIDSETLSVRSTVTVGWHPRGIAFSPDSARMYVAVWDDDVVAAIDLRSLSVHPIPVGADPRHLVMAPSGRLLYVSLNGAGKVAKIDLETERVTQSVATGLEPRSMAMSADGRSLYVTNYESDTISKIRTRDMAVLQAIPVGHHPIGITVDDATNEVWVACYSGSLEVFRDR